MMRWVVVLFMSLALYTVSAQPPPPPLLSPADVVLLAFVDASQLQPEIASYTRYLWLPNLPVKDRLTWLVNLSVHVNQLSDQTDMIPLRPVKDSQGSLLALNFKDYGWKADVLDQFGDTDPTFTVILVTRTEEEVEEPFEWRGGKDSEGKEFPAGTYRRKVKKVKETKTRAFAPWLARTPGHKKAIEGLFLLTKSQVPIINALVFLDNTGASGDGRKPDYYDIQGIKDEKTFQKLIGADVAVDVAFSRDLLATIGISGVTQEARAIQRIKTRAGAYLRTFDINKGEAKDKKNPLRILGTNAKGEPILVFDASEQYGHGSNELWKFGLFNNQGVKQARAPDTIAQDAASIERNKHSIINCVSCIRCHTKGGLQDIDDWVRNFPPELNPLAGDRHGKKVVSYEDARQLRQQYGRKLEGFLDGDRNRYAAALFTISGLPDASGTPMIPGLTPEQYAAQFPKLWQVAATSPVDMDWIVRETGIPADTIIRAVKHQVSLDQADPVLAQYALPPARWKLLPLTAWREAYGLLQQYVAELPP